jgi:hypothetical protein
MDGGGARKLPASGRPPFPPRPWNSAPLLGLGLILALAACSGRAASPGDADRTTQAAETDARAAAYRSPYSLAFSWPQDELIPDLLSGERGRPDQQSRLPLREWDSQETRRRYGAWGPPVNRYPEPELARDKPARWLRERVLATALRLEGYAYQHHHIPDFDPPPHWPWLPVPRGHDGKGVDCSDFTTFVYGQALGWHFSSDVGEQSRTGTAETAGGRRIPVLRIERPESWEDFARVLAPGDLLFIRNEGGRVSHVVLWTGDAGRSPEGVPLVLDSTGTGHRDAHGAAIPDGVRLRPFTRDSWYFRKASHALRLIRD